MTDRPRTATDPEPGPANPASPANPVEVPTGTPVEAPQPGPDVIDPAIGIPSGPSPAPANPGTPGAPLSPGVA